MALLQIIQDVAGLLSLTRPLVAAESTDLPDMQRTLLVNSLLPGTAQAALGNPRLGRRILAASLTLQGAGTALLVYDRLRNLDPDSTRLGVYRVDGRTYLFAPPEDASLVAGDWVSSTGLILSTWGVLVSTWSQWAAYREYADRLGLQAPRRGHESLGSLLAAPYRPENVFSADVIPFFPISVLGQLRYEDLAVYARFFQQERVDFWGMSVHPVAGLALNTVVEKLLAPAA